MRDVSELIVSLNRSQTVMLKYGYVLIDNTLTMIQKDVTDSVVKKRHSIFKAKVSPAEGIANWGRFNRIMGGQVSGETSDMRQWRNNRGKIKKAPIGQVALVNPVVDPEVGRENTERFKRVIMGQVSDETSEQRQGRANWSRFTRVVSGQVALSNAVNQNSDDGNNEGDTGGEENRSEENEQEQQADLNFKKVIFTVGSTVAGTLIEDSGRELSLEEREAKGFISGREAVEDVMPFIDKSVNQLLDKFWEQF